jgi:hypothetical protein
MSAVVTVGILARTGPAFTSVQDDQEYPMRTWYATLGIAVILGLLATSAALGAEDKKDEKKAEEKEEKVDLAKVPKPVLEAVKKKFPDAKMVGASTEKEGDKLVYEIEIKVNDKTIDVTVTPEGKIVTIEKEIDAKNVPRAVAEALEKKYPKATIKLVEEVSKDDKIVKYEFQIVTADKKALEVSFDPSGKFLEEEVKKEEKK